MRLSGTLAAVLLLAVAGCGGGSSSGDYPGGSAGKSVLEEHHYLDDDGQLYFPEAASKDQKVQAAACTYLFGTAKEVGSTAKLGGSVTLDEKSGFATAGGSGEGYQCGYDVKGKVVFSLVLWTKKTTSEGAPKDAIIDAPVAQGLYGSSAYAPGFKQGRATKKQLTAWLREASKRMHVGNG